MNLKEVSELRRRFRMDRNAISRIYGCFVNSSREIVSYIDESVGILPQDEAEKYLNLLKKALSGKLGKNLIDIIFSTEQVADSDEHRLLMALRDSQLKDGDIREEFYQKIINSLDLGDSNYLILLAHDTYDVPHKNKNDEMDADASDAVFSYVVCCVCPVKERKAELGFFPGDNEFHSCAGQIVAAPELGFVFPAFDDRAANIYNALFYSRKADDIHEEVIDSVFHTTAPMSAAEQKEAFQNALSEALGDACNMELVQSIHDRLRDQIEQHKEIHDPEPLELSVSDAAAILRDNGVEEEKILAFRDNCFVDSNLTNFLNNPSIESVAVAVFHVTDSTMTALLGGAHIGVNQLPICISATSQLRAHIVATLATTQKAGQKRHITARSAVTLGFVHVQHRLYSYPVCAGDNAGMLPHCHNPIFHRADLSSLARTLERAVVSHNTVLTVKLPLLGKKVNVVLLEILISRIVSNHINRICQNTPDSKACKLLASLCDTAVL